MLTTITEAAVSRGWPTCRDPRFRSGAETRRITAATGQRISAETWSARIKQHAQCQQIPDRDLVEQVVE